jgi:O-antigen ligase
MGNIISERLLNITNDGGSGRDRVWETTWGMIRKSYIEYLLLGHGYSTVLTNSPLGLSAHNDFLEVLYNWGIVLFIPYVVMHIALIKQVFIFIRNKSIYAPTLAFSYTIFFILSMISIVILYPLMGLIALTWGITSNLQESTKI